ncbi:hypothetical protein DFQ29_001003 [Apophysomyces sp. BC1021]|nr:hypothetical protein DFQ29_001003 [Apophysomyces sp. BC1021]
MDDMIRLLNERITLLEKALDQTTKERNESQAAYSKLVTLYMKLDAKLDALSAPTTTPPIEKTTKKKSTLTPTPTPTLTQSRAYGEGSSIADSIHAPPAKMSYAQTAAKQIPDKKEKPAPKKQTKKKPTPTLASVQRTLIDSPGPSQYAFVYLPCRHHLRHSAMRKFLGVLKVPQARIIDIQFPAKGTIALLVHAEYKQELVSLLTQNKVPVKNTFDPTSADILGDPKLASLTIVERQQRAQKIYQDRMLRTCLRLPSHLGSSVLRAFVNTSEDALRLPADMVTQFYKARTPKQLLRKQNQAALTPADFGASSPLVPQASENSDEGEKMEEDDETPAPIQDQ